MQLLRTGYTWFLPAGTAAAAVVGGTPPVATKELLLRRSGYTCNWILFTAAATGKPVVAALRYFDVVTASLNIVCGPACEGVGGTPSAAANAWGCPPMDQMQTLLLPFLELHFKNV